MFLLKGDVSLIDSEGQKSVVKKGLEVLADDEIITGKNSLAVLKIEGHSVHKIGANSKLKISSLPIKFQNSNFLQSPASLILRAGKILSNISKKSDNESLKIKTKNTSMGIRGTQLMTSLDKYNNLTVVVNEGKIEFFNGSADDLVESGQTLFIEKDKNIRSLGTTDLRDSIKWKFNSIDSIVEQSEISKVYSQKRKKYVKDSTRWFEFKKERKKKIKRWNRKHTPIN